MANSFYNPTGNPATGSEGLSSLIRAEFTAISAAFDVMPAIQTTGLFTTIFNQLGNYTFTLPGTPGTFALTADVAAETTRATGAEGVLTAAVTAETTRATGAEGVNATAITAETTARTAAVTAETNRATAAEATKQNSLGFIPVQQGTGVGQANNNVKIGWSAAVKLKLTIDATDQGNVAMESWVTPAIAVETARATAAEGVNATAITTETTARTTAVTNEATARNTAIGVETTRATAAEGVLATAIGAETTRATAAEALASNNIGRNLLHNGMDLIQQRGAGPWTVGGFGPDRWAISAAAGGSRSVSITSLIDADRTAIGDEAATYAMSYQFVGGGGAGDYDQIAQNIEDVRRTGGKSVTLSFWAKALSGTPKVGVQILQYFGTGGSATVYLAAQAVTLTTNWVRYSLTFAVPSAMGKTIGTGFTSLGVTFWFSAGATFNSSAGGIGVQTNTVSLFGRQLETGTVATPLEKLDISLELTECQRFYQSIGLATLYPCWGAFTGTAVGSITLGLAVQMRANPTVGSCSWVTSNCGTPTMLSATPQSVTFTAAATTVGNASFYNSTALGVSADL